MKYKENWEDTMRRFLLWWNGGKVDRPMLRVVARRKEPIEALEPAGPEGNPFERRLDIENAARRMRNHCRTHRYMAEAFPHLTVDFGPGSLATYLGSEPIFAEDTVWYRECIHDLDAWDGMRFDPENRWWKLHRNLIERARTLAADDFLVGFPDVVENIDILSAMRGPQKLCYDLLDEPEKVHSRLRQIDDLYFPYYDEFYDIIKLPDASSCYSPFSIWGPGKTAKVQCDFSALISPAQYREFVLPSLQRQCGRLTNSLYHLDGPDAIRHLDAVMEIKNLNALQWTAGDGHPDGAAKQWYPIYEKVRAAGKSLWIHITDGGVEDWIKGADDIVGAFGAERLYLLFNEMEEKDAQRLMATAEDRWS